MSQLADCLQWLLLARLILRCRQESRKAFARLRSDVLVKIELLDNKHGENNIGMLQFVYVGNCFWLLVCFQAIGKQD